MTPHDRVVEDAVRGKRTVMLVGGLDVGKTTLARRLLAAALAAGKRAALLDADLGQKTVGPPTAVTLRMVREEADLAPEALAREDAMAFVGGTSPQGHLLPLVTGATRLHRLALAQGADLVVVDTSGMVSGVFGQIVKYHKVEMLEPDLVIGLQRGEELLPLLGVIQRFFSTEVVPLGEVPGVVPTSVEERADNREAAMRRYFAGEIHRFRVKPTVFLPALPPLFDLAELNRLVVGLSDGAGSTTGLGYLEHTPGEEDLRLVTPVAAGPKALRLGAVRLDASYGARRVDLRNLFGSE
ncbi:MAG: Clp1/GlmU family protein [Actinomycetota bacterium]